MEAAALRHAHIGLVVLSVALFAARGAAVLAGARWPMHALPRRISVVIDTLLLAAGVWLAVMIGWVPFVNATWLGVKLLLLPVYIVLGSLALKRAPTRRGKAVAFVLALACVAAMAGIARHRSPAGWMAPVVGW